MKENLATKVQLFGVVMMLLAQIGYVNNAGDPSLVSLVIVFGTAFIGVAAIFIGPFL